MKLSIKDFFSKCDQIRQKLRIFHIYWRNPVENCIFYTAIGIAPILVAVRENNKDYIF